MSGAVDELIADSLNENGGSAASDSEGIDFDSGAENGLQEALQYLATGDSPAVECSDSEDEDHDDGADPCFSSSIFFNMPIKRSSFILVA